MEKMITLIKNILLVTLPTLLILFLLLEISSRLFFPGALYPIREYDKENLITKSNSEIRESGLWTAGYLSQAKAKWRINNEGWNSPIDYNYLSIQGIKRIAVIGDSYIEAFQVDCGKSYPFILNELLGKKYEVYSFGASGSPLSQYLHVSRYIEKIYNPDLYIINVVHNDFEESIFGWNPQNTPYSLFNTIEIDHDTLVKEVLPLYPDSRIHEREPFLFYFWDNSSFLRYLVTNIEIQSAFHKKDITENFEMNANLVALNSKREQIYLVTNYILRRFSEEFISKRVIFVMDAPRDHIYNNNVESSKVVFLNHMMDKLCDKWQLEFIDLTPLINEDYHKYNIRFESKWDNHWDEYGHRFVAKVLYKYLKNSGLKKDEL